MSLQDIQAMPVNTIASEDAVLFLWCSASLNPCQNGPRRGEQWRGGRPITAFNPLAEIAEQIRALSIQLNDCEVGSLEAKAISDQLNVLQGIRQSQYGAPKNTMKKLRY
jgi:hypothetical protein